MRWDGKALSDVYRYAGREAGDARVWHMSGWGGDKMENENKNKNKNVQIRWESESGTDEPHFYQLLRPDAPISRSAVSVQQHSGQSSA